MKVPWRKRQAACFFLTIVTLLAGTTVLVLATGVVAYTVANGKLQSNTVNDVFIYSTWGETSSADLAFDANWVHGIAKTTGDPTVNPSSNITLSGTQTQKAQKIRIRVEAGGATGTATFKTSVDGGTTWSTTTYTTQSTVQDLLYNATDTGLDVVFAAGANWTTGDIFTVASWWGEGAGATRGAQQDFPFRVVIVATDSGMEIIDLSNNSVWMRFVSSYPESDATRQNVIADSIRAVWALNGKVYLGSTATYQAGMTIIDFMRDEVWFVDAGTGWDYQGNIAMRNDGVSAGGWTSGSYPSLNSSQVNDIAAAVIGTHTLVMVGTAAGINAFRDHSQIFDNTHSDCGGNTNVPAVAIVGNATYWALPQPDQTGHLCVQYNPSNITATGSWSPVVPYRTYNTPPYNCLISSAINDISVRPNASPLAADRNIVYVATDEGLTIMHEPPGINYGDVECRHYGHTGSTNPNITYKILAGSTDKVATVDYVHNYTGVYVGTSDNAGGGALSVLRPYINAGDTPFLIDYYRTTTSPAILSNNITAVKYGGTDALLGTDKGSNRLTDAPTPVTVGEVGAFCVPDVGLMFEYGGIPLIVALLSLYARRCFSKARSREEK